MMLGTWEVPVTDCAIRLSWRDDNGKVTRSLRQPIVNAQVHFAPENVVFLEWSVGDEPMMDSPEIQIPLWRHLLTMAPRTGVATAADALDFTNAARNCFSPFVNPGERVDIMLERAGLPDETLHYAEAINTGDGKPVAWFSALAAHLLAPFGLTPEATKLMFDERARVVTTLVLQGEPPSTGAGKRRHEPLRARFASVDNDAPTHFYDPAFARAEMARGLYDRFESSGSLYFASSHSLSLLGYGWFPAAHGMKHMMTMYRRIFVVTLMYAAVFQRLWGCLEDAGDHKFSAQARADEVRKVRKRLTRFANTLWFDTLTHQIQGREMFELMHAQIPVRREYDELTAQLERLDALVEAERVQAEEERRDSIAAWGFGLASMVGVHQMLEPIYGGITAFLGGAIIGVFVFFLLSMKCRW